MLNNFKNKFEIILVIIIIFVSLIALSGCIYDEPKQFTHDEVNLDVIEKNSVKIFYKKGSSTQKNLAMQSLDILYEEYTICSKILNLTVEELNPCSIVFCKSRLDPYIIKCKKVSYVDGFLCWPIIGEKDLDFKGFTSGWTLYHMLPHEIVDTTLHLYNVNDVYGGWLIEGAAEYVRLQCAKVTNQLNDTYFLYLINEQLNDLSEQKDRFIDLSNRSSFSGSGLPYSKDGHIFYSSSLTYIYYLVDNYGDDFISDIIVNNCTTYEKIRSSIENSTGYDISDSIKNISLSWIYDRYLLILDELDIDYEKK